MQFANSQVASARVLYPWKHMGLHQGLLQLGLAAIKALPALNSSCTHGCCRQVPMGAAKVTVLSKSALAAVGIVALFAPTTCVATLKRAANVLQAATHASIAPPCFKPPRLRPGRFY